MYFNKNEEVAYNMGYRVDESGNLFDNKNVIKNLNTPKRGYNIFQINNANNKKMKVFIHRLVAYQKFGQSIYKEGIVVRHLNGISNDNSYDNIEIGTFSDNMFDIPKEKRIERSRKSNVKYKNEELKNILSFYSESKSYKKTMIKFNISSKGTLWHVLNKRKN